MESTSLIVETASRLLRHHCDPQTLNSTAGAAWQAPAWAALEQAGLPLAWVPEDLGGAGVSIEEGFGLIGLAGRYALALPLTETLLAGWLLARAGIAPPQGALTCAPTRPRRIGLGRHLERSAARDPLCRGGPAFGPDRGMREWQRSCHRLDATRRRRGCRRSQHRWGCPQRRQFAGGAADHDEDRAGRL